MLQNTTVGEEQGSYSKFSSTTLTRGNEVVSFKSFDWVLERERSFLTWLGIQGFNFKSVARATLSHRTTVWPPQKLKWMTMIQLHGQAAFMLTKCSSEGLCARSAVDSLA
jgi:hypothetical protein